MWCNFICIFTTIGLIGTIVFWKNKV
jgi:hypothetical protein